MSVDRTKGREPGRWQEASHGDPLRRIARECMVLGVRMKKKVVDTVWNTTDHLSQTPAVTK